MTVQLHYLPQHPTPPTDNSPLYVYGTPEYDHARQTYCRDMRHYNSDVKAWRKICAQQRKERLDNGK